MKPIITGGGKTLICHIKYSEPAVTLTPISAALTEATYKGASFRGKVEGCWFTGKLVSNLRRTPRAPISTVYGRS